MSSELAKFESGKKKIIIKKQEKEKPTITTICVSVETQDISEPMKRWTCYSGI